MEIAADASGARAVIGTDGAVWTANESFCTLVRLDETSLRHLGWRQLVHAADRRYVAAHLVEVLAGGAQLREFDVRMTAPDLQGEGGRQPDLVLPAVREDGSVADEAGPDNAILRLLAPLPRRPLEVGQSDDVPVTFPFDAFGVTLLLRGKAVVTLTGFAKVGDRTCAVLEVVLDVSQLEVPRELPGTYQASLKGTSTLHFDLAEGALVSGYDPVAMASAGRENPDLRLVEDPYELAEGMDALVICTEWNEFKQLDLTRIRQAMAQPLLLDGRNIYEPTLMQEHGFIYRAVGRGATFDNGN